MSPPADLAPFLRSYFYIQSHAWPGITAAPPHPLSGPDATHKARLPHQYILPLHATMKEVISTLMGQTNCTLATAEAGSAPWFSAADLAVYVNEFSRTGFQGMLNGYRVLSTPSLMNELQLWAGKKVEVPSLFLGGDKDWSLYQLPGALEGLGKSNAKFYGVKIIHNCGHYPHQERPEEMAAVALDFLSVIRDRR
jgi:pimeloyl-ACP methyl ester carboxylesterase